MAIFDANEMIRMMRMKSGLSQEKFCEDICSTQALSNIENGKNGISPVTFQMLAGRANLDVKPFPCFASKDDFTCFMDLHRAEFLVDSWQFALAYEALDEIEELGFANNKFYYQRWLLLNCKIQALSEKFDHETAVQNLIQALRISIPDFKDALPEKKTLTPSEIQLFILIADAYLSTGKMEEAMKLVAGLENQFKILKMSDVAFFSYTAELAYVKEKILLQSKDYDRLLEDACEWYKKSMTYYRTIHIFHFAYMNAIALYEKGKKDEALSLFRNVIAGSGFINSIFSEICIRYIKENTDIPEMEFDDIRSDFLYFEPREIKCYDADSMRDGIFSLADANAVTYGRLLRILRKRNKMSAEKIGGGLCSKSQYSKIENDLAKPSVVLARSLIERAGVTENLFDFFGNDEEFKYADLSEKIGRLSMWEKDEAKEMLSQIKRLKISDDKLINQEIRFYETILFDDSNDKAQKLMDLLDVTDRKIAFEEKQRVLYTEKEFNIIQHFFRIVLKQGDNLDKWLDDINSLVGDYSEFCYDYTQLRINVPVLYYVMTPFLRQHNRFEELKEVYSITELPLMQHQLAIKSSIHLDYLLSKYTQFQGETDANIIKKISIVYHAIKLSTSNEKVITTVRNRINNYGINMT